MASHYTNKLFNIFDAFYWGSFFSLSSRHTPDDSILKDYPNKKLRFSHGGTLLVLCSSSGMFSPLFFLHSYQLK